MTDAAAAARPPERVSLVLYVSPRSSPSVKAQLNLERLLKRFNPEQVDCVVQDLTLDISGAENDRVVFTPTLVKRSPEPRAWIVGDLADGSAVIALLRSCGVEEA